jgi:hypothetical protein
MVVDREVGRGSRISPRWLDSPRGEAFLVSVGKLTKEEEAATWPMWLSPTSSSGPAVNQGISGGRRPAHGKRSASVRTDDDPRLPPGIPAPTGA